MCLVLSDKPVLALALSFSCVPPRSRLRNSTRPPEICQPPALVLFLMVWVAPKKHDHNGFFRTALYAGQSAYAG